MWKVQVYGKLVFAEVLARLVSRKQKPNLRFKAAFRACVSLSENVESVGS
ncbi:hypothetical protein [Vibrio parahaemolyticus]|nr:hypothetical protein [Vibrio parahaemolyticus]